MREGLIEIAAEKADDDGQPPAPRVPRARTTNTGAARTKLVAQSVSEDEDEDFDLPELEDVSHSSEGDSDDESDTEQLDRAQASTLMVVH
ncbi:hypothetical protein B0H13DRAFT_2319811 [Mycena leptocephala]|nr:hypothetical protein B0H13DRAFT_2319811 [Mycena leptocephala]